MKTVALAFTLLINTIYLSRTQVAEGTVIRKHMLLWTKSMTDVDTAPFVIVTVIVIAVVVVAGFFRCCCCCCCFKVYPACFV